MFVALYKDVPMDADELTVLDLELWPESDEDEWWPDDDDDEWCPDKDDVLLCGLQTLSTHSPGGP